jgi:hypothetical protein
VTGTLHDHDVFPPSETARKEVRIFSIIRSDSAGETMGRIDGLTVSGDMSLMLARVRQTLSMSIASMSIPSCPARTRASPTGLMNPTLSKVELRSLTSPSVSTVLPPPGAVSVM